MSDTVVDTELEISEDGSHDKFAHYVDQDEVMQAFVYGVPVVALCGKIWVPTRDGAGYKICPTCEEVYSELL